MKTTIENLLRIDGSEINDDKTFGDLTHIIIHKNINCNIEYLYNSKLDQWWANVYTWDYEDGTNRIPIKYFDTIEEVIKQIYYITGFGHGIRDKKYAEMSMLLSEIPK